MGRVLRKLDRGLALVAVGAIVLGTGVAGVFGGWRLAGLVGLLLFLILDGPDSLRAILTHSRDAERDRVVREGERDRALDGTKDNPTVR